MKSRRWAKFSRSPFWPALLSAFVIPGAGQLFNGEWKKGLLLVVVSLGGTMWFFKVVGERLAHLFPGSPENWPQDPQVMREAVVTLVNQSPEMFFTFQIMIVLTWGFGIVDAYLTARGRKTSVRHAHDHD